LGQKYEVEAEKGLARARVCACAKECAACGGTGNLQQSVCRHVGGRQYTALAPCECRLRRRRIQLFNQARVPAVLAHASFENFQPERSAALGKAREAAIRFCHGYKPGEAGGVVLAGPVGTGKSHLLAASVRYLTLESGVACQYVEMSFLFSTIRQGFGEGKSGVEIIAPLAALPVLAVDELGKGRGSEFELATLEELVARRDNAGLPTLFTSNFQVENIRSSGGYSSGAGLVQQALQNETLAQRVGARTFSRIQGACELVQLPQDLPDRRQRNTAERVRSA
jgi:DNA replication protein DnaC